ncbi:MAG: GtrA family protein [Candidatus Nanogingivalaceae bacterium]|nr:GtrA family protein [Candidatus Nanogingivalaceae bacterium]
MKNKMQIGRFAIVGTINTAIDFGLLFLLTFLGLPKIAANTVSTGSAFVFSFFANKKYTFKSTNKNIKYEIISFIIITLFGLWVLQNGIIWLITPLIKNIVSQEQLALFAAKLLATAISLVWNYCLYDKVVFKKELL